MQIWMKVSIALAVAGAETPRASEEKINGVVRPGAEHYVPQSGPATVSLARGNLIGLVRTWPLSHFVV